MVSQMKPSRNARPSVLDSLPAAPETSDNPNTVAPGSDDDVGVTAMGLVSKSPQESYLRATEHFGDSSAIAFIQQLHATLRLDPTSSTRDPTQSRSQHLCLKKRDSKPPFGNDVGLLPPRALADHLVSCYFSKIHTLYPFVHEHAFMDAYQSLWSPAESKSTRIKALGLGLGSLDVSSTTFYFALNVVFALGCQFSSVVLADREVTSEAFFHQSKPALDLKYLENGDLALCQLLLLMAHYLQSSSTPNRCWHVIGMACREAQALGLHSRAGDKQCSFAEIQIRRRVWHGCAMLDLSTSTMLGRPPMISHSLSTPKPQAIDDCYLTMADTKCEQPLHTCSRTAWFVETLKLHDILRTILFKLYTNGGVASDEITTSQSKTWSDPDIQKYQSISQIDADLQAFEKNLPRPLDWKLGVHQNKGDSFMREKLLLKARFSYLKILLYRPSLSHMTKASKQTSQGCQGIHARYSLDYSIYCTEAAIDLASIVHQTCTNDLASSILTAVSTKDLFTAASIILLAELSPLVTTVVTKASLEDSWAKCYSCFDHLRLHTIVAERCAQSLLLIRSKCLAVKYITDDLHDESLSADGPPTSHRNELENPSVAPENTADIPFSEESFEDLKFDDDTSLDPFWFGLQF
ncbi:hypothetical protein F1880_005930 [Penicillium rolfsii]|nr:hypothetical protein F1880_005930 [Penicillium rolfsii]